MKTFLQSNYSAYISNLILMIKSLTIFQKEQSFENARKIITPIWQSLEKHSLILKIVFCFY